MDLAVEVNREMYLLDMATLGVQAVFITHESSSGNTVQTEWGQRLRTDTQGHKIFFSQTIAEEESDALMLQRRNAINEMARDLNIR